MKTQCPHCADTFSLPAEYTAKQIKCLRCKQLFTVAPHHPPPVIDTKQLAKEFTTAISRTHPHTPRAFKVAFLSTLGVISAFLMAFYVYGHFFVPASGSSAINLAQVRLAKDKLFLKNPLPQYGILRGRYLSEYSFLPDANHDWPSLSLWIDDSHNLAGISTSWYSTKHGSPTFTPQIPPQDIDSTQSYLRYRAVSHALETILQCDIGKLPFSIKPYRKGDSFYSQKKSYKWQIDIIIERTTIAPNADHIRVCTSDSTYTHESVDPNIYFCTITAINW